jgi:hypothetical protein
MTARAISMTARARRVGMGQRVGCVAFGGVVLVAAHVLAQTQIPSSIPPPTFIPDIKFASGRNVVPYLEGWIRNPDESFDFVFGYFNRNTVQEFAIPAGPDNSVMPGGPDRGQPTYFMARREQRVFRVRVPKDWGDKQLTWTLTANGRTEKVVAQLLPSEEINEHMMIANGNNTIEFGEEVDANKPPEITLAPVTTAGVAAPLTLTAMVTDDGLPKPKPVAPPREAPPTRSTADGRFLAQRNSTAGNRERFVGLRVSWLEYRGPAKVTFETNPIVVTGGKAVTTARFTVPGTYTLIATATDSALTARTELTVTVK